LCGIGRTRFAESPQNLYQRLIADKISPMFLQKYQTPTTKEKKKEKTAAALT
jgi:hypothetical protein